LLGDIFNETARRFASIIQEGYAADDIRITVNQGFLLKFVPEAALVSLFNRLYDLDLTEPGFDSTVDITACPGTDTCNLGIASSTGIARELERVMKDDYPDLIYNHDIKIKISGCMNACGQHNIANIGFQGMTIRSGENVMPAMQILLGGGFDKEGNATIGSKTVKVPSKVAPDAFRALLDDFHTNAEEGEYFNNYYNKQVEEDKMYFFNILKPFTKLPEEVTQEYFIDWGEEEKYVKAIGVGECAGVVLDLVGTLIQEAEEKFEMATKTLHNGNWQDAIYHCYNTFVVGAKALLIGEGVTCNTQIKILKDFDSTFVGTDLASFGGSSFEDKVLQLKRNEPSLDFAKQYYAEAEAFINKVKEIREEQVARLAAENA
jgi:sulfite reductase (ferredoxin)